MLLVKFLIVLLLMMEKIGNNVMAFNMVIMGMVIFFATLLTDVFSNSH